MSEPTSRCALCGAAIPLGADWVLLDVESGSGQNDPNSSFWTEVFCTTQHAGEWLVLGPPEPEPYAPIEHRKSWRDTAGTLVLALIAVTGVALGVVGAITVVRFIVGLF